MAVRDVGGATDRKSLSAREPNGATMLVEVDTAAVTKQRLGGAQSHGLALGGTTPTTAPSCLVAAVLAYVTLSRRTLPDKPSYACMLRSWRTHRHHGALAVAAAQSLQRYLMRI